ncbi:MAG: hypothetical protein AB1749_01070 [Pseudomonadota bacterium]
MGGGAAEQHGVDCHGSPDEASRLAPPLAGVIARRAGSAAGFVFSRSFAGPEHAWRCESLDAWLASVTIAAPDLAARNSGVADPFERQMVRALLAAIPR